MIIVDMETIIRMITTTIIVVLFSAKRIVKKNFSLRIDFIVGFLIKSINLMQK